MEILRDRAWKSVVDVPVDLSDTYSEIFSNRCRDSFGITRLRFSASIETPVYGPLQSTQFWLTAKHLQVESVFQKWCHCNGDKGQGVDHWNGLNFIDSVHVVLGAIILGRYWRGLFASLETRIELEPRCLPQLSVGSFVNCFPVPSKNPRSLCEK